MLIRVQENDDWIVDYDTDNHLYKVSYFEDYHFVDQCRFNCCEERSITSAEAIGLYYKTLIRGASEYARYIKENYPDGIFPSEIHDSLKDYCKQYGNIIEVGNKTFIDF